MVDVFQLPKTTFVNRIVPKNAFDEYTDTKQKKLFTDLVFKITWTNKLAADTINLSGKALDEIQVIQIELKTKHEIPEVLAVIDRASPYAVIFVVYFGREYYLSASSKHAHPVKTDMSVIDWTFKSEWLSDQGLPYRLNLKETLDFVFFDFCKQLSGFVDSNLRTIAALVEKSRLLDQLQREGKKLKSEISRSGQFNKKVELNLRLSEVLKRIEELM